MVPPYGMIATVDLISSHQVWRPAALNDRARLGIEPGQTLTLVWALIGWPKPWISV
jgi:hypothetical protein